MSLFLFLFCSYSYACCLSCSYILFMFPCLLVIVILIATEWPLFFILILVPGLIAALCYSRPWFGCCRDCHCCSGSDLQFGSHFQPHWYSYWRQHITLVAIPILIHLLNRTLIFIPIPKANLLTARQSECTSNPPLSSRAPNRPEPNPTKPRNLNDSINYIKSRKSWNNWKNKSHRWND